VPISLTTSKYVIEKTVPAPHNGGSVFFRRKATPSGPAWQLVESFRNDEGQPRQRIVACLGNATLPAEEELKLIAKVLERKLRHPRDFFDDQADLAPLSQSAACWVDRIYRGIVRDGRYCQVQAVGDTAGLSPPSSRPTRSGSSSLLLEDVLIDGIGHENSAMLGALLPVKAAWESLGISECLRELGFSKRQVTAAAASIIGRVVEASSEYSLVRWIPTTALPELLGEDVLDFDHKCFYRTSDKLLENQEAIEAHLRRRSRKLFAVDRTVILYDLTNTYFEGQALGNEKARRGNSKEKRHDRPLVVLGMIYDGSGFALAHKTFAGNTNDGKSLLEMVEELRNCNKPGSDVEENEAQMELDEQSARSKIKTLVVLDAGISTRENLVMLKEAGFSYLVNDTRGKRSRYREEFGEHAEFGALPGRTDANKKPPVEVRMLRQPAAEVGEGAGDGSKDGAPCDQSTGKTDTILLCRSQGRRHKEEAMFSKAEERFRKEAEKLDLRLKNRRLAKSKKIHQAIGRLKAKHSRVQRYYEIGLRKEGNPSEGLLFEPRDSELRQHRELFGCYVLRTDRRDLAPEELWSVYIGLTQAEEGFRALKTDLGLRPNFHQKQDRVDGHIFITVIAFHLWKWIRQKLDCANDTRDWVTVRRLLRTHCYATLIVPCEDGAVYHLRKPGRPEAQQQQLYKLFGIDISNLTKTKVKFGEISTK